MRGRPSPASPAAAALAYVATLVVNTPRIAIAIHMHTMDLAHREELHRLEGTIVYLGGLCALYALARCARSEDVMRWLVARLSFAESPDRRLPGDHARLCPCSTAPRGARDFVAHAMWVLAGCGLVVAAALLVAGVIDLALHLTGKDRP